MPEMPEVQAHAERLTEDFGGDELAGFRPLTFTALKTYAPAPDDALRAPCVEVGRRGKYLLLRFEPVTFVVHLMQGGRLKVDEKQAAKPRAGRPGGPSPTARPPADRGRDRAQGRRVGRGRRPRRGQDPARRPGARGRRPRPGDRSAACWPSTACAARVAARPADRGRHRPPARQRDLPPGQAVAVRLDRQARRRGRRPAARGHGRVHRRVAGRTSAPGRTCRRPRSAPAPSTTATARRARCAATPSGPSSTPATR